MIASDECDSVGISDFQGQQEQEGLHTIEASIHEIAQKQVVDFGTVIPHFEQLHQIIELSMDVSADSHGGVHSLHVGLLHEYLPSLVA